MGDPFIAREAAHARAVCRHTLRQQVAQARQELGLPSREQERWDHIHQVFNRLTESLKALGNAARVAQVGLARAAAVAAKDN